MFFIENDTLKVGVDAKGAELKSVIHKRHELEYMWSADPAYWAKTSPALFPIVGALKNNSYQYGGKSYSLPRHGFARDKVFKVVEQHTHSIVFSLESDQDSLQVYPFHFKFSIVYTLHNDQLSVAYRVQNRGSEALYFSVGGHPAFKVPLIEGTSYEDYRLNFEKEESAGRWPISKEGLIEKNPEPFFKQTNILPLTKDLFRKDAVVLKHLKSEWVELVSDKTRHGLHFTFSGFPYLGLWAAPGADFLCIEPWCGIADSVDSDQQLTHKEGIMQLPPKEDFEVQWIVRFY
jgi:galactose mutarotase-like enzyme